MKIQVNKLPGLHKVADGYIYDTVTKVMVSTRIKPSGSTLYGTYQTNIKRYTLQLARTYKSPYCKSFSVSQPALELAAQNYASNNGGKVDPAPKRSTVNSNVDGLAGYKTGWIIGSFSGNVLKVAEKPKVHLTEESVKAEMERLALTHLGVSFVKLKVESYAVAEKVSWKY